MPAGKSSFCIAAALAAVGLLGVSPAKADNGLLGKYVFRDAKCNRAFQRYLSCFAGNNMKKCYARFGREDCDQEHVRARGDHAVAYAMFDIFDQPGCAPETYLMIEKNIKAYQSSWGCEPW